MNFSGTLEAVVAKCLPGLKPYLEEEERKFYAALNSEPVSSEADFKRARTQQSPRPAVELQARAEVLQVCSTLLASLVGVDSDLLSDCGGDPISFGFCWRRCL